MVLLLNHSTDLLGGCISVDVERLGEIWIGEHDLLCQEVLKFFEGSLTVQGS